MVRELLPDVRRTVFRPSIVLGDSRRPETTQFDMVRAFVFLAGLPVLPFRSTDRIDIVPVDYVAESVVALHQKPNPEHEIYHLSSGTRSETFGQLTHALAESAGKMEPLFWPGLERNFSSDRELAVEFSRPDWPQRVSVESVHAVSRVGHGIREFARRGGNGPRAGTIFQILLSAAAIQPRSSFLLSLPAMARASRRGPRRRRSGRRGVRARVAPMMDLVLEALDQLVHRTLQRALEVWRGAPLAARREAETALCRIQRHAQHGLGRSRRGNAAAGSARAGREQSGAQRDVSESGLEPRLFWRRAPGTSSGHLSAVSVPRSAAASRRDRLRRLDVQKQIRGCAHHDVHRRAGNRFGRK